MTNKSDICCLCGKPATDDEAMINELLVTEITSSQPLFLPSPSQTTPRLAHGTSAQRQPGTNAPDDDTNQ